MFIDPSNASGKIIFLTYNAAFSVISFPTGKLISNCILNAFLVRIQSYCYMVANACVLKDYCSAKSLVGGNHPRSYGTASFSFVLRHIAAM